MTRAPPRTSGRTCKIRSRDRPKSFSTRPAAPSLSIASASSRCSSIHCHPLAGLPRRSHVDGALDSRRDVYLCLTARSVRVVHFWSGLEHLVKSLTEQLRVEPQFVPVCFVRRHRSVRPGRAIGVPHPAANDDSAGLFHERAQKRLGRSVNRSNRIIGFFSRSLLIITGTIQVVNEMPNIGRNAFFLSVVASSDIMSANG